MAETTNTVVSAGKFTLNLRDGLRGLLMAAIGAALTVIYATLQAGSLTFNWESIGVAAGVSGVGYLLKNFFTPAEIVIQNPSKADFKAVEAGRATVEVTKTPT